MSGELIERLRKAEAVTFDGYGDGTYALEDHRIAGHAADALASQAATITQLQAELAEAREVLARINSTPRGTRVRKASGPQWEGVVVGHYSSSFTPDGLVIECTVEGAKGQVHVEPAKRMEVVGD